MCSVPGSAQGASDRDEFHPEAPFRIRADRIARDVLAIEFIGDLDGNAAPLLDLSNALQVDPSDAPTHVDVDLKELRFLDTAGLSALQTAIVGLEAAGMQVTVTGARHEVRRLLTLAAEHCWLSAGPILAAATPP